MLSNFDDQNLNIEVEVNSDGNDTSASRIDRAGSLSGDDQLKSERRNRNRKNKLNLTEFLRDDSRVTRGPINARARLNTAPVPVFDSFNAPALNVIPYDDEPKPQSHAPTTSSVPKPTGMALKRSSSRSSNHGDKPSHAQFVERLRVAQAMSEEHLLSKNEFEELKNKILHDMFGLTEGSRVTKGFSGSSALVNITESAIQPSTQRRFANSRLSNSEDPNALSGLIQFQGRVSDDIVEQWKQLATQLGVPMLPAVASMDDLKETWDTTKNGLTQRFFPTGKEMMPTQELVQFLKTQHFREVASKTIKPIIQLVCGDQTRLLTSKQFENLVTCLRLAVLAESQVRLDGANRSSQPFGCIDYGDDGRSVMYDLALPMNLNFFFDKSSGPEREWEQRWVFLHSSNQSDYIKLMLRYQLPPVITHEMMTATGLTGKVNSFQNGSGSNQFTITIPVLRVALAQSITVKTKTPQATTITQTTVSTNAQPETDLQVSRVVLVVNPVSEATLITSQSRWYAFDPLLNAHNIPSSVSRRGSQSTSRLSLTASTSRTVLSKSNSNSLDRSKVAPVTSQPKQDQTADDRDSQQAVRATTTVVDEQIKFLSGFRGTVFHPILEKLSWGEVKGPRDNGYILIAQFQEIVNMYAEAAEMYRTEVIVTSSAKDLIDIGLAVSALQQHAKSVLSVIATLISSTEILHIRYHAELRALGDEMNGVIHVCGGVIETVAHTERHARLISEHQLAVSQQVVTFLMPALLIAVIVVIIALFAI